MIFKEFGKIGSPTVLIPAGMMADASYERNCYMTLEENYHVIYPAYDGFYPGSDDFTSIQDQASKIEDYINEHHSGHVDNAYGASFAGLMLVELLSRRNINIDTVFLDGVYVAHQGKLAGHVSSKSMIYLKNHHSIPSYLMPLLNLTMKLMGTDWDLYEGVFEDYLYWDASDESIKRMCMQNYTYVTSPQIAKTNAFIYLCCGDKEPYAKKSHEELKQYITNYEEHIIEGLGHGEMLILHSDKLVKYMSQVFEEHRISN